MSDRQQSADDGSPAASSEGPDSESARAPSPQAEAGEGDTKSPEIAEAISKMPTPVKHFLEMFAVAATSSGPRHHPIFDKFTDKHVDKFLEDQRAEDEREYRFQSTGRNYQLAYVVIVTLLLAWMIYYLLPRDKGLLIDIIKIVVAFAGGFGSGVGWKAARSRRND